VDYAEFREFRVHLRPFCDILRGVSRHSPVRAEPADGVFPMNRASRKRRSRLLVEGPLAPYYEPYAEYLADQGYSQISFWKKTFLINEFSRWLSQEGISVDEITTTHEEAFLRYRAQRRCPIGGNRIALSGVTGWLREKGIIEYRTTSSVETSAVDRVLQEYRSYLREDRGLASATIENYAGYVRIVARAISRAGIEVGSTGAHQLRHALAVDMLRQGASLTDIGQVLRHRSPEATRRYAKVDLEALREVALPWPGAMP